MPRVRDMRYTSVEWEVKNPILMSGEHGYELDTGRFKIGDGLTRYNDLQYFLDEEDTLKSVRKLFATVNPSSVIGAEVALEEHIEAENPHPAYDEGPSFALLYQNAKV